MGHDLGTSFWQAWTSFWQALPTFDGILLATAAVAFMFLKEIEGKLKDHVGWRRCIAALLLLLGIGGFISDRVQSHQQHIDRQKTEEDLNTQIAGLKGEMQKEEIAHTAETKYLEGQLDAFKQYAPAVLKLAEAAELNTRKEYEQKVLTNQQLREFVAKVVTKMRDWQHRYDVAEETLSEKRSGGIAEILREHNENPAAAKPELDKFWSDQQTQDYQQNEQFQNEFQTSILGDAISARNQLIERLGQGAEPQLTSDSKVLVPPVFQGRRVEPYAVNLAAAYLEQFAKKLNP